MNAIQLAWYQVGAREWAADSLYGKCRVVGGTFPGWYKRGMGVTVGFTVYFKGNRVGWTVERTDAERTASGFVTAHATQLLKDRGLT